MRKADANATGTKQLYLMKSSNKNLEKVVADFEKLIYEYETEPDKHKGVKQDVKDARIKQIN